MGPCDLIVIAKREFPEKLRQQDVQLDLDQGLARYERRDDVT
jgi:hypothetical protein